MHRTIRLLGSASSTFLTVDITPDIYSIGYDQECFIEALFSC